ncbi:MAG TPA: hypothetical protein VHN78_00735 [Chloroflexota bacterium]|nr:hypothetical protein [Chloroflexota bacterium]
MVARSSKEEEQMVDVTATAAGGVPALGGESFRAWLDYVRPKPEEVKWQAIPWQTDIWEARRLAVQQGKPIFLWAMNGNPLGCT